MWPFKSPEEKIAALDDELAGKLAEHAALETAFRGIHQIPAAFLCQSVQLDGEIAVLQSKLTRLKTKLNQK